MKTRGFQFIDKFTARLDRYDQRVRVHYIRATDKLTKRYVIYAKREAPVRTGYLRSSIRGIRQNRGNVLRALVRADAPYAGYVHDGTSRHGANPFFERAYQRLTPEVIKEYNNAQDQVLRDLIK